MARRKSPEDQEWEDIFNAISFDTEPDPKYIKEATVVTKFGKKIKLDGYEFYNVMAQERSMLPEHAVIESCKVILDFDKLKMDINNFAHKALRKVSRMHPKSKAQMRRESAARKATQKLAASKPTSSKG
jgi:hypothetical protein